MQRILLLLFVSTCLFLSFAKGQGTVLVMKDSVRVTTDILSIKDNLLLVKDGALSLSLIHSVWFSDSLEIERKPALVYALIEKGVLVYSNNKKIIHEKQKADTALIKKQEPLVLKETSETKEDDRSEFNPATVLFGFGIGLDYGGLGGRFTFSPAGEGTKLGIFVAGGYAINGIGFNTGLTARIQAENHVVPTVTAMYGYNGVIKVIGASQYDKTYYGPSIGVGAEVKSRNNDRSHVHLELVLPFRPQAFNDDLKIIRSNGIEINDPFPVLISVGYHSKF